jgi:hypothetical protein
LCTLPRGPIKSALCLPPFFFYLFPASIVLPEPATMMILLALRPISSGNLAVHFGQRRDGGFL